MQARPAATGTVPIQALLTEENPLWSVVEYKHKGNMAVMSYLSCG